VAEVLSDLAASKWMAVNLRPGMGSTGLKVDGGAGLPALVGVKPEVMHK
jgi:hypothetical protein